MLGIVGVRLRAEKPGHAAAVVHCDDDAVFAAEGADIRHAEVAIQKDAIAGGHVCTRGRVVAGDVARAVDSERGAVIAVGPGIE